MTNRPILTVTNSGSGAIVPSSQHNEWLVSKLYEMGLIVKNLTTVPEQLPTDLSVYVGPVAGLGNTKENLEKTNIIEFYLDSENQTQNAKTWYLFKFSLQDM